MNRIGKNSCKSGTCASLLALALACCAASGHAQSCGAVSVGSATISARSLKVPAKAWEHFRKARLAAERHNDAEFERESARGLADAPEFAVMYLLRAAKQVSSHEYTSAIASVAEARRIEPEAPWAGVLLASAYNGMGRYDAAASAIQQLRGTDATTWQAMHEMARAEVGLRHTEEALLWSERAVSAAPAACVSTRLVRANALIVAERWSEAADELNAYLVGSPEGQLRPAVEATMLRMRQRARSDELRSAVLNQSCTEQAGGCPVTANKPAQTSAMVAQKEDPTIR